MQRFAGAFVPQHIRLLVLDLEHVVLDAIPLKLGALRRAILPMADDIPHSARLPDGTDLEEAYSARGWRWYAELGLGLPGERGTVLGSMVLEEARVLAAAGAGKIYPGVPEMLESCREAGLLLALGADCDRNFMLAVSDCHGLDGVFDLMVCAEDYGSGGLGELLEDVTERLEVHASECVYLGTRVARLEEARGLGVAGLRCGWGLHGTRETGHGSGQADRPDQVPGLLREIDQRTMESEA